jgi:hypothetical protein
VEPKKNEPEELDPDEADWYEIVFGEPSPELGSPPVKQSTKESQADDIEAQEADATPAQSDPVVKAIVETVYTDGIDEVTEVWHDEEQNLLWGSFRDGEKSFEFEIDLESGEITY